MYEFSFQRNFSHKHTMETETMLLGRVAYRQAEIAAQYYCHPEQEW